MVLEEDGGGGTQDGAQRWACPGPQACGPEEWDRGSLPF